VWHSHGVFENPTPEVEAIRLYWESARADLSPTSMLREIEVELPA
jgi:hypothetical protein